MHVAPTPQVVPHTLQLLGSVIVSVHTPLHRVGVGALQVPPSPLVEPPVPVVVPAPPVPVVVPAPPVPVVVVMPPVPVVVLVAVMPPVPVEVVLPPVPDSPPVPVVVLSLLPQPIAAPCSATPQTASVSHARIFIRALLFSGRDRPAGAGPEGAEVTFVPDDILIRGAGGHRSRAAREALWQPRRDLRVTRGE